MGGVIEDFGRSNAFQSINTTLGRAIELRQSQNQEDSQALGKAIDLERLGMARESSEREKEKFSWAVKAQKDQEKVDKIPIPITTLVGSNWEKDPAKKMQVDKMKELGLVSEVVPGVLMTTPKSARALKEYGANNLEWTKQVNEQNILSANAELDKINAAIGGDKEVAKELGLKPEELAQKKVELSKKISGLVDSHQRVDLKLQSQLAVEREKGKALKNAKRGVDTNSPTGYSYFDSTGNVVLSGAPKPASAVADKRLEETTRHNKAMESIKRNPSSSGSKRTALIQNSEFLASLGWDKKEAAELLTSSKPMSRETFIGQTTMKVMANEMFEGDEKINRIKEAALIYDTMVKKTKEKPTSKKMLDDATALQIYKQAGGDKDKARQIAIEQGYNF